MIDAPTSDGSDPGRGGGGSRTEQAAAWAYEGIWSVLAGWLRVPREPPTLPAAEGKTPRSFRPAPDFLRYLKWWFWVITVLIDLAILIAWVVITVHRWWLGLLLAPLALALAFVPDIVAYIALHLRYDTTWYVLTEQSLRIRRGAWIIQEMTFTFDNVQNVRVQQGPIQRLHGIASVLVETAGSGRETRNKGFNVSNRGVIEGISNATEVRDIIGARLRRSKTTGLGDETGAPPASDASAWTPEHLAALRDIRAEIVRLRPPSP